MNFHNHSQQFLITAPCHPWLIENLEKHGSVIYKPAISYQELLQIVPSISGLVVTTRLHIDAAILNAGNNLQWIGRLGSGLELIDVKTAEEKGIRVVSSPEGNANAVGEHALGMLLNVLNRMHCSHQQIANGQWIRAANRGTELGGKTIGIIGFGHTGPAFAKLLAPFDCTILVNDVARSGFGNTFIREASIAQIQQYAEVISFHVPLNVGTMYMANENFFAGVAQKPIIINTCRGKVVHLKALLDALDKGLISGAALDVLENEQLSTYTEEENHILKQLLRHPDVIITPHIAGYSHQAFLKMAQVIYQKIFKL